MVELVTVAGAFEVDLDAGEGPLDALVSTLNTPQTNARASVTKFGLGKSR